ncbi:hypothetical protein Tco_1300047 [Tanacetum coccineum]
MGVPANYLRREILSKAHREGVGLRMADSHTSNHSEGGFTPFKTIRRLLVVIGRRSHSCFKGETFKPERRVILPKKSQTILDAPLGYIGLYTHHFSLSNLRLPIPPFICKVLNYFKVHISGFNPFGMVKLTTFAMMCKAYGGKPSVDLLRSFLNLGPVELLLGENKLDKKSFKDKVPLHPEMDPLYDQIAMSFMLGGVDGELNFLLAEVASKVRNSPSTKSINDNAPVIDVTPLSSVYPSNVVENVVNSDDPTYGEDEQTLIGPYLSHHPEASKKFKILGKRKVASGAPGKALPPEFQKVSARASMVASEASTPLYVESDPDIHGML